MKIREASQIRIFIGSNTIPEDYAPHDILDAMEYCVNNALTLGQDARIEQIVELSTVKEAED